MLMLRQLVSNTTKRFYRSDVCSSGLTENISPPEKSGFAPPETLPPTRNAWVAEVYVTPPVLEIQQEQGLRKSDFKGWVEELRGIKQGSYLTYKLEICKNLYMKTVHMFIQHQEMHYEASGPQKRDESRISRSERRTSDAVKQERTDTRAEQSALKEFQEEEEEVRYERGITD
ncbi:hypothetical protein TNCV_1854901 [Trichonephila clavipes]|nr:hypothetical protein TNCV_1854901 [Trichonephila clavipes]